VFNVQNLKSECFGGGVEIDQFSDWDYNKSKNAYILFYQREDF
jgi:hypothetical protein